MTEQLTLLFFMPYDKTCHVVAIPSRYNSKKTVRHMKTIEEIAEENPNVSVLKIDVDEVGVLAARFGIQSIPTLMLFKNGQRVETRVGYQNKNQLLAFINQ